MKKLGFVLTVALAMLFVTVAKAQNAQLGVIITTGPMPNTINYGYQASRVPVTHAFQWATTGTAPTACTLQVEGSLDNLHWFPVIPTGDTSAVESCTTNSLRFYNYMPLIYIRVNVLTYTAGDITTSVAINYATGASGSSL